MCDIWDSEEGKWRTPESIFPHPSAKQQQDHHTILAAIPTDWLEELEEGQVSTDGEAPPPSTFVDEWGWQLQSGKLLSLGAATTCLKRANLTTPAPSRGPSRWGGTYPLIHPGNCHRAWTQLHRLVAPPRVRY